MYKRSLNSAEVKVRFDGRRKNVDFVLTSKEREDILTILDYADWLEREQQYSESALLTQ